MTIDIDRLTEAELVDLNRRIVERLRFLQPMRAHAKVVQFSLGAPAQSSEMPVGTGIALRMPRVPGNGHEMRRLAVR